MVAVDWQGLAGWFLVVEGVFSIVTDEGQPVVYNAGRVVRIGIGLWLLK